jgi:methionine-rich copper-binding protein CopC
MRSFRSVGLGLIAASTILVCGVDKVVRAMEMVESFPSAKAVVTGLNVQYVVRFDELVDHRTSELAILQQGRVIQRLPLILRSDPKSLTASAPKLPTGQYELRWSAHSMSGETSRGAIPFNIAP